MTHYTLPIIQAEGPNKKRPSRKEGPLWCSMDLESPEPNHQEHEEREACAALAAGAGY